MAYQIRLSQSAAKQLSKLDKQEALRITSFLKNRLANFDDPRRAGKALTGPLGGLWRYKVGDYRLICDIQDEILNILVIKIGDRKEIYKKH